MCHYLQQNFEDNNYDYEKYSCENVLAFQFWFYSPEVALCFGVANLNFTISQISNSFERKKNTPNLFQTMLPKLIFFMNITKRGHSWHSKKRFQHHKKDRCLLHHQGDRSSDHRLRTQGNYIFENENLIQRQLLNSFSKK